MPIKKPVTLLTIAKQLNLTVHTVSKALKGKPGMSEETRYLVMKTAEQLGYMSKEQIRSLKLESVGYHRNKRYRFLLVQMNETVSYKHLLMQGLHDRFTDIGHEIELVRLPRATPYSGMRDWLVEKGLEYADGMFITPSLQPKQWESRLLELAVPKILLNYPSPGTRVDSVVWDVYEATWQSVLHLRKAGHERIMYIGDVHAQPGYMIRWQAFIETMHTVGAEVNAEHHYTAPRSGDWLGGLAEAIDRNRPTALICGIDQLVPQVYETCLAMGLSVPGDISIVGFLNVQPDGLPKFARPLFAIRETGYRAADLMLWRIANPSLPYEHIRIQSGFMSGETIAPCRLAGKDR